ncbi:MAG: zinc ABC transporter substrate-binding protein [Myxococcales bacterium]|nr:zinc ABC transporter substrate-binding protein [Myxococcales bacterium]
MRKLVLVFVALALALLPGCSKGCGKKASARPSVVVSIYPIFDLVREVAGPDADVSLLLQPGKNEHTFDPTPKDIERAAAASLGVMVGLGLDPWMEKLMKDAAPKARLLQVGQRVPTINIKEDPVGDEEVDKALEAADAGHDDDHDHGDAAKGHDDHDHKVGAPDPHVWLDPQRARIMVNAIGEELSKADSAHALGYRQRAAALEGRLDALDKEIEGRTKALSRKGFVTFHGSFGYFADRYKLRILAVIEPFPGSSPSSEYVQRVLKVVKDKQVPALFSEPQLDPRPAKILADEAKVPLGVLDPVGGGPETDSYEKMIRYDMAQLEKYLK